MTSFEDYSRAGRIIAVVQLHSAGCMEEEEGVDGVGDTVANFSSRLDSSRIIAAQAVLQP